MNTVYNNAYTETLFIIKCLPYNEQNKISKKFLNFLNENKNNEYIVNINPNISLYNQQILEETKVILKHVYISYFISNEERERIIKNNKYKDMVEEDLKKKKYDYNNLFKKKDDGFIIKKNTNQTVAMIKYKEPIFIKIINKLKSIFNK